MLSDEAYTTITNAVTENRDMTLSQLSVTYRQVLKALIKTQKYRNDPIVTATVDRVFLTLMDKIAEDSCAWVWNSPLLLCVYVTLMYKSGVSAMIYRT